MGALFHTASSEADGITNLALNFIAKMSGYVYAKANFRLDTAGDMKCFIFYVDAISLNF